MTYNLERYLEQERLCTIIEPLSDMEFAEYILKETEPEIMDNHVKNNRFPAYKIAGYCKESGRMSERQRIAIRNVYLSAYS